MKNNLEVFFFGELVGFLVQDDEAQLSFHYSPEYLSSPNADPISLSLPLEKEKFSGALVEAFFGGFLPEADIRHALAKNFGISEENNFSFLNKIGGDCAGAVSVGGDADRTKQRQKLSEKDLSEFFRQVPSKPLLAFQDSRRISLAGAQHKLVVLLEESAKKTEDIYFPAYDEISTHIIKPAITGYETSCHNEYFCMELARRLGFRVPKIEIRFALDTPYLLIERYDRDGQKRLHHEDFTQVLGVSYKLKYQAEGGFGYKECFDLVTKHCNDAAKDKLRLLELVIFNFLIANNDAHGKNFSLLYRDKLRQIELAPCYDLLTTSIYEGLDPKMAMKIGKEYNHKRVRPGDWEKFAKEININKNYLKKKLSQLSQEALEQAKLLKEKLSKDHASKVYDEIIEVIEERAKYAFI